MCLCVSFFMFHSLCMLLGSFKLLKISTSLHCIIPTTSTCDGKETLWNCFCPFLPCSCHSSSVCVCLCVHPTGTVGPGHDSITNSKWFSVHACFACVCVCVSCCVTTGPLQSITAILLSASHCPTLITANEPVPSMWGSGGGGSDSANYSPACSP